MGNYLNLSHQKTSKKINKKIIQFIVLILIIISVSFVSYKEYKNTLKETTDKLNTKIINFHIETFSQLSQIYLKDTHKHFVKNVKKNSNLRNNFEDMLRLIRISSVQNLFVVTKDSDNNYCFLLDSDDDPRTRSNFLEPFNPLEDFWDKCYELKKPEVFYHKNSKELWVTIAYPIVENNQTVAILAADISYNLNLNMQTNLKNFSTFFLWILVLSALWFIALYILTLYFREKFYEGYDDPLTKINNRKYLYDILMKKLAREYQLFMVDIDFFKKVNDAYGHDAGDYILKEVSQRLYNLTRDEDSIIRYGGEEFLIYTTLLTPEKCVEFAERLRKNVKKEPIVYKDISCNITVSIGCNPYGSKNQVFADVLKKADKALYMAKQSGRDCVKTSK